MRSDFLLNILNKGKTKVVFIGLFLLFFVWLIFGLTNLKLNQDITESLPKGESFKELNSFLKSSKLNNQLAFSLETNELDADEIELIAEKFTDSLNVSCSSFLNEVKYYNETSEGDFYDYFYQNLNVFISETQLDTLKNRFSEENIRTAIQLDYNKIISPEGIFLKDYILKDPLSITPMVLKNLNNSSNKDYTVENGITFSNDKKYLYIFTTLDSSINGNSGLQAELAEKLENIKKDWNVKHQENQIDYFSPFLIAVANANQIKIDTTLTLSLFIGFALLLLLFYYRKISVPIYFLLPAVFGLVFALGSIAWFKGEISAISVATGAIVLGIILDYSFHFFTHYRHSNSLIETVKELVFPLTVGSFTTIVAFLALQFTNSIILQDFGLFAALSLLGAAFFTLTVLPIILDLFHFKFKEVETESKFNFKLPFKVNKTLLFVGIMLLTLFFGYKAKDISFDSDLENLSFHPKALKEAEYKIFKLNPENEKKIFLFSKAKDLKEAENKNFELYNFLKNQTDIKQINSVAPFTVPLEIQEKRNTEWNKYWTENKENIFNIIDDEAAKQGFSEDAFAEFKANIEKTGESHSLDIEFLEKLGLDKLIDISKDETVFITTIVVDKDKKDAVLAEIRKNENVEILDRSSLVNSLLEIVRNDFNFILVITSLIVFLTLLVVYGRIEIALVVFAPMLISWIWILGLAAVFDIQFNFVNIIITTFIFGLGDDFSIFISDGILNKYKYGKNVLGTYRTAIVLSALTTIVGTGVLMFAKHPAVNSIGLISVLGMLCILFISLVLQPMLFDWLIFNRIKKGRSPWTLSSWLLSAFAYTYFVFGCFVASIIATVVLLIPMSKKLKRKFMSKLLHYFGASLLYIMFNVSKNFYQKENLDLSKPSILIANHSSVLDIIITLAISHKVLLVTNNWVYNSPVFGYLVRTAGFILNTDFENNLDSIQEKVNDGYSIMIFPEGTRSKTGEIARFKKGAFYLAEKLKLDITPVLIHGANVTMAKSDFQLKNSWLNVKYMPRIKYDDKSFGENYSERTKSILNYFRKEHQIFSEDRNNNDFLREPLLYNYIYKGPILEWYFKVKYQLEKRNFAKYNEEIVKIETPENAAQILDLGCGYGYLEYYLFLKNKKRSFLGLDYDENKIEVAQHNYLRNNNLHFKKSDLRSLNLETNFDVIFIMDVLHYFNKESQAKVLLESINHLNKNGIIFIRDGISDLAEKHEKTKFTEFISSNVGFNKKDEEFCFINKEFITKFAQENQLELEIEQHSEKTSNVLFILKKLKA